MSNAKRVVVGILIVGVLLQMLQVTAFADNEAVIGHALEFSGGATYDIPTVTNEIEGWPQGPAVMVDSAILMDADTEAVLYDKGMDERRYPASITKIMTTLVALENANLDDVVTFSPEGLVEAVPGNAQLSPSVQVGEQMTMEQCLYAVMLSSANEVSTQVAITVGGSVGQFADMMNAKAAEIGCQDTHFVNANGLHDEDHYTTAHDMALIARAAYQNEEFQKITGTKTYEIPATNMTEEPRELSNHQALLNSDEWGYDSCVGGKTGYTDEALNTLVTYCKKDDQLLIAVTMHYKGAQVVSDTILLMEYGFSNFQKAQVSPVEYTISGGMATIPQDADASMVETRVGGDDLTQAEDTYLFHEHVVGNGIVNEQKMQENLTLTEQQDSAQDTAGAGAEAGSDTAGSSDTGNTGDSVGSTDPGDTGNTEGTAESTNAGTANAQSETESGTMTVGSQTRLGFVALIIVLCILILFGIGLILWKLRH